MAELNRSTGGGAEVPFLLCCDCYQEPGPESKHLPTPGEGGRGRKDALSNYTGCTVPGSGQSPRTPKASRTAACEGLAAGAGLAEVPHLIRSRQKREKIPLTCDS